MLNISIAAIRGFLIIYICTFLTGCWIVDVWLGPTPEKVYKLMDANKDGQVSPDEIKASKYDLNKDGLLSMEEMLEATKGSNAPSDILMILAGLNIPFAGAVGIALKKIKENKAHVRSMAGGIEDLIHLGDDGYSKEDIYAAIALSAKHRGDAKALQKVVREIKDDIRLQQEHIKPGSEIIKESHLPINRQKIVPPPPTKKPKD